MKKILAIFGLVSIFFTIAANAEPNDNDLALNIPTGSTLTTVQNVNFRPNEKRFYFTSVGTLTRLDIINDEHGLWSRSQKCFIEAKKSEAFDRLIRAGTALKIEKVEYAQTNDPVFQRPLIKFIINTQDIDFVGCDYDHSPFDDTRIGYLKQAMKPVFGLNFSSPQPMN